MFRDVRQMSKNGEHVGRTIESMMLLNQKEAKPIKIDCRDIIRSVAFLVDGKHVVSGGREGKIRRWQVEDGEEVPVGRPMDAGSFVLSIAVSQDGKWVVSGTESGQVTVWNAESHSRVTEFQAHDGWVVAADVSPEGTRIATGSHSDKTACVWSLSTRQRRLLDPLKHDFGVVVAKFSPDGRLIATGTSGRVRVYDSYNGSLLVEFPVLPRSVVGQSLAWANDSKQLFALSSDGNIHRLDVSTETTLSNWAIHSSYNPTCIALASNGTFIAAYANGSISFWDVATREQIGSAVEHPHHAWAMAISTNYNLVVGGGMKISLWRLCDTLPPRYFDNVRVPTSKNSHEITC